MTGTITIDTIAAPHAKSWLEVTPQMARNLAPFLLGEKGVALTQALELSKKGKGKNEARIAAANEAYMNVAIPMLLHIINTKNPTFWKKMLNLTPEHLAMIIGSSENPIAWCLNVKLVHQLYPTVKHQGNTYLGPRDYLKGMTFGEYLTAQARYSEWIKNRTIQNLAQFFGILYRPERTDVPASSEDYADDPRTPFIAATIQKKAEVFETFSESTMLVSILYWQGCHARMRERYVNIFRGTSSRSADPGEVMISLAKSPGKEDVAQIQKSFVHTIMRKLNMDAKPKKK